MAPNLKRGFKRVYAILSLIWVAYTTTLWPLKMQQQAIDKYFQQRSEMIEANYRYRTGLLPKYNLEEKGIRNAGLSAADLDKALKEMVKRWDIEFAAAPYQKILDNYPKADEVNAWPYKDPSYWLIGVLGPPVLIYGIPWFILFLISYVRRGFSEKPPALRS